MACTLLHGEGRGARRDMPLLPFSYRLASAWARDNGAWRGAGMGVLELGSSRLEELFWKGRRRGR